MGQLLQGLRRFIFKCCSIRFLSGNHNSLTLMCAVIILHLAIFEVSCSLRCGSGKTSETCPRLAVLQVCPDRLKNFSLFSMPVCNSRSVFESLIGRLEDLSYQTIEWYVRPLGLVFFPIFGFELIINQSSFALLARWC